MQVLIDKTLKPERIGDVSALRQADGAGSTSTASCKSAPTPTSRSRPSEAIAFGAEGIGLCRTEHMFFDHIDDSAR